MKKVLAVLLLSTSLAHAQSQPKLTNPSPKLITTGLTYQQLLPLNQGRGSVTIQNNMTSTDNCWLLIGGPWQPGDTTGSSRTVAGQTLTAQQASILLTPALPYTRYYPYVPSDQILGTCQSTGDSLYVDTQ